MKWRRRVWLIFSVLSLIGSITALVCWPRSFSTYDDLHFTLTIPFAGTRLAAVDAGSAEGHTFFSLILFQDTSNADGQGGFSFSSASGKQRMWNWTFSTYQQFYLYGAMWQRFGVIAKSMLPSSEGTETLIGVALPHWATAILLLVPTGFTAFRWFRRPRTQDELCMTCGYDLRASPDRCPECGAIRQGQFPPGIAPIRMKLVARLRVQTALRSSLHLAQ